MRGLTIEFGTLHDVLGRPVASQGFTFVPALVQLAGDCFSIDYQLAESIGDSAPLILQHAIKHHCDAAWVRARLPQVFGLTPESSEGEKSLLDLGFVAVRRDELVGYPFVCTDDYGQSGLMFSPDGPDSVTQAAIAEDFWTILLTNPEDLADFEAAVYHSGAGVWLLYACDNGEILCGESEENPLERNA